MSRALKWWMMVTDIGFLAYWSISALALFGAISLPPDWMYGGFDDPRVVAWNWSFLSIDLPFSILGLAAVAAHRRARDSWRALAILSLAFTFAAGGMAISYWAILGEWDPFWFLSNLLIMVWPLFFLPGLVASASPHQAHDSAA